MIARADAPGAVHVDLSGQVYKESLQGYRYNILCKYEFTNVDFIYFFKDKSEIPPFLNQMIIDFERISGTPVSRVHSENGTEFTSQINKLLFAKEKVKHYLSAPYCPQQNGRIEREMQTIAQMARTGALGIGFTSRTVA